METFLGVQLQSVMFVLVLLVALILALVILISLRSPMALKLGVRNIPRRPAQTMLIVVGLTLSTVIIASSLGTGDTLAQSIRSQALQTLGPIDEVIAQPTDNGGASVFGSFGAASGVSLISQQRFEALREQIKADAAVDAIVPAVDRSLYVVSLSKVQGEMSTLFAPGPEYDAQLGGVRSVDGASLTVGSLAPDEVYLSQAAADRLDARAGDVVQLLTGQGQPPLVKVKAIVKGEGLGQSPGPVIVMPLARAQTLLAMDGQISEVLISNRGEGLESASTSAAVTERLRVPLIKEPVAQELAALLRNPEVLAALESAARDLPDKQERLIAQVAALRAELGQPGLSDRLRSLMADDQLMRWVLDRELPAELKTRLGDRATSLSELRVDDVKARAIAEAELGGNQFTLFFTVFGIFSIMAGVLLINLIFVMLAAERKSEMGMARAVGTQRRHLIQMFVTEGLIYDLLAATLGVVLGLGVSYVMVGLLSGAFGNYSDTAQLQFHMEPRSLVIAYCMGVVLTFLVVLFSSWRVSRLNIVSAIRDLPDDIQGVRSSWWQRYRGLLGSALLLLLGAGQVGGGYAQAQRSGVLIGISLLIIGAGVGLDWVLNRTAMRTERRSRLVLTLIGGGLLIFWMAPFGVLDALLGLSGLATGMELFVVSGLFLVVGAILFVMANADLLMGVLSRVFGRFGNMAPVLKTATAYPLSARFRTGMALAMFSLVIFTLVTLLVWIESQNQLYEREASLSGGFEVQASLGGLQQIPDLGAEIAQLPELADDVEEIGTTSFLLVDMRQVGAREQAWQSYRAIGHDPVYLEQIVGNYKFSSIAEGYASDEDVWRALRERDDVVVLGQNNITTASNPGFGSHFKLEGAYLPGKPMPHTEVELRDPNNGAVRRLQVIGIVAFSWSSGLVGGVETSSRVVEQLAGKPVPPVWHWLNLKDGVDSQAFAQELERSFLMRQIGVDAVSMSRLLGDFYKGSKGLIQLFEGFLALGLLVGIAALGVISSRAVVERRQQIGMLRAIGYRQSMVGLSFVLESSFIALLGILIGTVLGLNVAWNLVNEFATDFPGLTFAPPWGQIAAILALSYLFSLVTTIMPARKAARIYPAQALRYE